jgi:hypothetical protein
MHGVKINQGWADRLRPGSEVIVQAADVPEKRPSTGYRYATVESVTPTEVRVDGIAYRRGRGRSQYLAYVNEGCEIARLSEPYYGRIWPVTAATRRWLDDAIADDAAADDAKKLGRELAAAVKEAVEGRAVDNLRAALAALGQAAA